LQVLHITAISHSEQITGSDGKVKQITQENPSNNSFEISAAFAFFESYLISSSLSFY
jgi:hypothetical protein